MAELSPFALPQDIEWRLEEGLVPYRAALDEMIARNAAIGEGTGRELVWLLEHPPVYTAGTSAAADELLDPRFEVVSAGRGGRYTYHGPGQRIGYLNIDLRERGRDVRNFVHHLEGWMIGALGDLGIAARRAEGRIGIWTDDLEGREAKIGALGIRVRRWVTLHGFSINVNPDLSHFGGIVPCGLAEYPVTSMAALGVKASMADLDAALKAHFPAFVGRLRRCPTPDGAGVEQCETGR